MSEITKLARTMRRRYVAWTIIVVALFVGPFGVILVATDFMLRTGHLPTYVGWAILTLMLPWVIANQSNAYDKMKRHDVVEGFVHRLEEDVRD